MEDPPSGSVIVVKRPVNDNTKASYLYNTILKGKAWEKVTLMVEGDEKMFKQLNEHGITFYKMGASSIQASTGDTGEMKQIIPDLIKSIKILDDILSTMLTNDQIEQLAKKEQDLTFVVKTKERAEAMLE